MGRKLKNIQLTIEGAILHADLGIINKKRWAEFVCPSCTEIFSSRVDSLKTPTCKSCSHSKANVKHGGVGTKLYATWQNMRARVKSSLPEMVLVYGSKGITVCESWGTFEVFREWAEANNYVEGLKIDRRDNDGNYCPENCRWVTQAVQSQNTRVICASNKSGYRGVSWSKQKHKWWATIYYEGKQKHLGYYVDKITAAKAYDDHVVTNNLEHAINFPDKRS